MDSPFSLSSTGPATPRHTPNATSASGYPTFRKLCSNSSSTHGGGTCTARAAIIRSRSFTSSPVAVATAIRTKARVCGSRLTVTRRRPHAARISTREPSIYTHLPHRFSPRIRDRLLEQRRGLRLEAQLGEHRRDRKGRREAVAVLDLQRDAESFAHEQRAVDAFGTDLGDDATRMRAHHLRAGTTLARDQLRMQGHRFQHGSVEAGVCERPVAQRAPGTSERPTHPRHPQLPFP